MGTISEFLSLARAKSGPEGSGTIAPIQPIDDPAAYSEDPANLVRSAHVGRDNEILRTLLSDTGNQLSVVDELTAIFGRLIGPLNDILIALEQEKAESARTNGALAALRHTHDAMSDGFQLLENRFADLDVENKRLHQELDAVLSRTRDLDTEKGQLNSEAAGGQAAVATLEKQLNEEINCIRALTEEKLNLGERAEMFEERAVALEIDAVDARQNLSRLETAKTSLKTDLDRALAASSILARKLAESEKGLSEDRHKLGQMEKRLGTVEAQRIKIAAACEMSNERRQKQIRTLSMKLDALQTKSDTTDNLLVTTRQGLVARFEEIRVVEANLFEANAARIKAEKKTEKNAAIIDGWKQQGEKLQEASSELTDKCRVTTQILTASGGWLVHAQQKIRSLTDEVQSLQADAAANRSRFEEDVVQLNATMEHERCERALAQGALETIRRDYARLQGQMAQERALRRGPYL